MGWLDGDSEYCMFDILFYQTSNPEKETNTGKMTCSHLCWLLCFCLKVPFVDLLSAKAFLFDWRTEDQTFVLPVVFHIGSSWAHQIWEIFSFSINYPLDFAVLTDFFINTSQLINESVVPLSVWLNHPPTSEALLYQNSQFVPAHFQISVIPRASEVSSSSTSTKVSFNISDRKEERLGRHL